MSKLFTNGLTKKATAFLAAFFLILTLVPLSVSAKNVNPTQIVENGGDYQNYKGDTPDNSSPDVKINKTIAETGTENEFDITLTVKTKSDLTTVLTSEDAATVLVIDISGSMAYCTHSNTAPGPNHTRNCLCGNTGETRLSVAKDAAEVFVETYAASGRDEGGIRTAARWLSVVTFSKGANVVQAWIDVSNIAGETAAKAIISNLQKGADATNVDAGLMLARNLLQLSGGKTLGNAVGTQAYGLITNNNVILLSDGAPNNYMSAGNTASCNDLPNNTNITSDSSNGTDVGATSAARAVARAGEIRANSFSITTGSGKDSVTNTYEKKAAKVYTIAFSLGASSTAVQNFLRNVSNNIQANHFEAGNVNLVLVFKEISHQIEITVNPWTVTDPMGDYMIWGTASNAGLSNIDFKTNTLYWNLLQAASSGDHSPPDADGWVTYTLTYRVKLDTLKSGFEAAKPYSTNKTTTLEYLINNGPSKGQYTVEFDVPSVKGFEGTVEFKKLSGDGKTPLEGASFELTHDSSCTCGVSSSFAARNTTSGTNGKVEFNNLPSGHTYKIIETATVGNHLLDSAPIYATVSFGDTSFDNSGNSSFNVTDKTFINKYDKHKVTVEYYVLIDGTPTRIDSLTESTASKFAPGEAYYSDIEAWLLDSIIHSGKAHDLYLSIDGNSASYNTLDDLIAALKEAKMGNDDIVIKLYYASIDLIALTLIKTIQTTDNKDFPSTFKFTFTVTNGTRNVGTIEFTQNDFSGSSTANKSVIWADDIGYDDLMNSELWISETISAGDGWIKGIDGEVKFATITGGEPTLHLTNVTNVYNQPPAPAELTIQKFFVLDNTTIEDLIAGMGHDGAVYNCIKHPYEIDHICDDNCPQAGVCTVDHGSNNCDCTLASGCDKAKDIIELDCTQGPECSKYTFTFDLQKSTRNNHWRTIETKTLTLTGAALINLINDGTFATVSFTIPVSDDMAGTYRIREHGGDDLPIGWARGNSVSFTVNKYGEAHSCSNTIANTFGGAEMPELTIIKTLESARTGDEYMAAEELSFTFSITGDGGYYREVIVTVQPGQTSGFTSIDIPEFYGRSGTLYIAEISGPTASDWVYDNNIIEVEIVNGVIDSDATYQFNNIYADNITPPDINVIKTVIGASLNGNEAYKFTFEYSINGTGLDGSVEENDTFDITVGNGNSNTKTISIPTNFTGTVKIKELPLLNGANDQDSKDWRFASAEYEFIYKNGVLENQIVSGIDMGRITSNTAVFANAYVPASISLDKAAGKDTVMLNETVPYTITIKNNGTQPVVINEINDSMFDKADSSSIKVTQKVFLIKWFNKNIEAALDGNTLKLDSPVTLLPGSLLVITYNVKMTAAGNVDNTASVTGESTITGKTVGDEDTETVKVIDPESSTLEKNIFAGIYSGDDSIESVESFIANGVWQKSYSAINLPVATASVKVIFKVTISDPHALLDGSTYNDSFGTNNVKLLGAQAGDGSIYEIELADLESLLTDGAVTLIYIGTVPVTTAVVKHTNTASISYKNDIITNVPGDDNTGKELKSDADVTVKRDAAYPPQEIPDPTPPVIVTPPSTPDTIIVPEQPPMTDIPAEDPPLAMLPPEEDILIELEDEEPPLTGLPQTGASTAFIP